MPFGALFACCGLALAGLGLSLTAAHAGCNSGDFGNTFLLSSAQCRANASSANGLAVGSVAIATGDASTAVGTAASALGSLATAVGFQPGPFTAVNGATTIGGLAGFGAAGLYSTALGAGFFDPNTGNVLTAPTASGSYSIAIGGGDDLTRPAALADNTFGVAIGTGAVAKGVRSTSVGAFAGYNPLGAGNNRNSSFGEEAGQNVNGGGNTATGLAAGVAVTGDLNSSFGNSAGITVAGNSNTTAGVSSGVNINGSSNAAYGDNAGRNVTGNGNTAFGDHAGTGVHGSYNIAVGRNAGSTIRSNHTVAIGTNARATVGQAIAIGYGSIANVANAVSVGSASNQRRIMNVANAVALTDAVNLGQVQTLMAAGVSRGGLTLVSRSSPVTAARHRGDGDKRQTNLAARSGASGPAGNTNSGAVASRPGAGARAQTAEVSASVASCDTSSTKVLAAIQDHSTSSALFAPIAQSGISFQQGGAGDGCVNLLFSAEALAPGATLMEVRAVLDDAIEAAPGPVYFTQGDDVMRSRAFNFLFPQVSPGPHRVEVHFRSSGEPGTVRVGMRTTMLQYVR